MTSVLTSARTPDAYVAALSGWQQAYVAALRTAVRAAAPTLHEQLKWGHLVYLQNGPVLLLRAEPTRVLFRFWRGQRLRRIEPRLEPSGKYEKATLALQPDTPLRRETVLALVRATARVAAPQAEERISYRMPALFQIAVERTDAVGADRSDRARAPAGEPGEGVVSPPCDRIRFRRRPSAEPAIGTRNHVLPRLRRHQ